MPRRFLLALAAVLLLAPIPAALAQDVGDPQRVVEDAVGDAGDPVGRSAGLDLVGLDVAEGATEFQVRVEVVALDPGPQVPLADGAVYDVRFAYGGVSYLLHMVRGGSLAGPIQATLLWDRSGGEEFEPAVEVTAASDPATQSIVATVPRNALLDQAGAPAFAGRSITGFSAASSGVLVSSSPAPHDRAPDDGVSPVEFMVRYGVRQEGHASLSSPEPFRASNGQAATFRFEVEAQNTGSSADVFDLTAERAPAGWQVHVPDERLDLAPGERRAVEILADVPFAHQHGRLATFGLTLASRSDPGSVGRILLGILYTEPAQPSGHHDTLVVHSRVGPGVTATTALALGSAAGGVDAYMNTLAEDPGDAKADIPPGYAGVISPGTTSTFTWMVPLRPGLALGLDFDLARTGEVRMPFAATGPLLGATLAGSVRLLDNASQEPGAGIALASLVPVAPIDVSPGQTVVLEATVVPGVSGDYIPFEPGQDLWLELTLAYGQPDAATGPATPKLSPGGTLRLPLLEYKDRIPGSSSTPLGDGAAGEPTAEAGEDDGAPGLRGAQRGAPAPGLAMTLVLLAVGAFWRRRP